MGSSARGPSETATEWNPLAPEGDAPEALRVVADAALERNARDAVILDLRGLSDATDFFFIASGDSDVHTRAIAENISRRVEEVDETPAGVEGHGAGRWILLDYIDIVVHIFLPSVRDYYRLERLWGDAPRADVEEESL